MRQITGTESFYAELPGFREFAQFADVENYHPLPRDWLVVVADIVNSTAAITRGMHRQVNSISTALVIAVLNVFDRQPLPFVFGVSPHCARFFKNGLKDSIFFLL